MADYPPPGAESILDSIPVGVIEFDHGHLVYANQCAHQMFAIDDWDANAPELTLGSPELVATIDDTAASGKLNECTVEINGRFLQCASTFNISTNRVTMVAADISSAERLIEVRRDFVANASHELKTPVTGMLALAESLELAMERDPERAKLMVVRIRQEAVRLSLLVRELLDLNRLEVRAYREGEGVDLRALCFDQIARVGALAESLNVQIRADIPEPFIGVGSREYFKTIVSNLLANAVRYNKPGGEVVLFATRSPQAITLVVQDTGYGIGEEHLDRIFERFYRVDQARSRDAGGTGLGLSIVRHATEQMGGSIQVHSVVGEGSTFTVTIPTQGTHDQHLTTNPTSEI